MGADPVGSCLRRTAFESEDRMGDCAPDRTAHLARRAAFRGSVAPHGSRKSGELSSVPVPAAPFPTPTRQTLSAIFVGFATNIGFDIESSRGSHTAFPAEPSYVGIARFLFGRI